MKGIIRLLSEDDFQAYKTIRLELLENHPTSFGSDYDEESLFDDSVWKSRLSKDTVDSYGVFDCDQIIGLGVVVYNPRKKMRHIATLNSMYIKPEYREQGLASKLMNTIIKDVTNKGIYRLNLSVVETNIEAKQLYESKGFKEYGIEPDTIFYEGIYHNLLLMSLLLK